MGIFAQRPEEPTEWAGLPSEPAIVEPPAARLDAAPAADLLGLAPTASSLVVPVVAPASGADDPDAGAARAGDDDGAGSGA